MLKWVKSLSKIQILAILVALAGVALMVWGVRNLLKNSREMQVARSHDFAGGNLSPDLLRPWMTLRYVAVAYAVPLQYLFNAIGVEARPETSMLGIERLNQQIGLGYLDGQPALLGQVRQAITDYRAHPLVTGLFEGQVEPWMSVQYVANSTGVPAETILQGIHFVQNDSNLHDPLEYVSKMNHYSGGPLQLALDVQAVVDQAGGRR